MFGYFDVEYFFDGLFDGLNTWVYVLDDLSVGQDDVVVLPCRNTIFLNGRFCPNWCFLTNPHSNNNSMVLYSGGPAYR